MTSISHISPGEVKVLFALLDSAAELGLLRNSGVEERWKHAKPTLTGAAYQIEGQLLWELMEELDWSKDLRGTWIQERWNDIRSQALRSKSLTRNPFYESTVM